MAKMSLKDYTNKMPNPGDIKQAARFARMTNCNLGTEKNVY